MKLYPVSDWPTAQELIDLGLLHPDNSRSHTSRMRARLHVLAKYSGETRPPLAGEWYLSGAIPAAYRVQRDLSTPYPIAILVTDCGIEATENEIERLEEQLRTTKARLAELTWED